MEQLVLPKEERDTRPPTKKSTALYAGKDSRGKDGKSTAPAVDPFKATNRGDPGSMPAGTSLSAERARVSPAYGPSSPPAAHQPENGLRRRMVCSLSAPTLTAMTGTCPSSSIRSM